MIAIVAFITSFITLATAIIVFFQNQRQREKIQEIHVLVNQRMTDVLERVEQLTELLQSEGINVPGEK